MTKTTVDEDLSASNKSAPSADLVPYYVRACMLGIPAYLIGVHLWTWIESVQVFLGGQADFRRLYASGYMVRSRNAHLLYDVATRFFVENHIVGPGASLGFDHPAYETLLFVPFSYFSYKTAYLLFLVFNIGLLAVCFWLLRPWTRNLRRVYRWLPVAMFLAFLPICAVLIQGQDSVVLLLLIVVALRFLENNRDFLAGLVLAIGLFKFQILIPIAALFLLWKRFRFVAGFVTTGFIAIFGSFALVGIAGSRQYIQTLAGMSVDSGSAAERLKYVLIPTAMPNIRGFLFGTLGNHLPNIWIQILTILFSAVVFAWAALATKRKERGDALLVAILTASLVSYHLLMHDMVVLLIPAIIIIDRFLFAETSNRNEEKLKLRAAALLFTAPVLMGWSSDHFYLAVISIFLLFPVLVRTRYPNASSADFQGLAF
jgi:hypothetical protein